MTRPRVLLLLEWSYCWRCDGVIITILPVCGTVRRGRRTVLRGWSAHCSGSYHFVRRCSGTADGFRLNSTAELGSRRARLTEDTAGHTSDGDREQSADRKPLQHNFLLQSSNTRHDAVALRQSPGSAVALADNRMVLCGGMDRTCNATPAVFGLQAALPPAAGAGLLRNVQRVWLL